MLDWDDLRFFLAVARSGSLSKAAKLLRVAQPTVGRRLQAFEERLGAKLLLPSREGQELSPTGRKILAYAERAEQEVLGAVRVAAGRDAGLRGRVTLTGSEWMLESVVAPLLGAFVERYPELELELLAEARHLSLLRREADLALRPSRFDHAEVVEREVAVLRFGLYASHAYLATFGMPNFSRGADGQRLILMSEALTKIPDVDWLPAFVGRARVVARANGRGAMLTMTAAGVGMACLPRCLGDAMPSLRKLETPLPEPERKLFLGVHKDVRAVARVKASFAFLVESFERLRPALRGVPFGPRRVD